MGPRVHHDSLPSSNLATVSDSAEDTSAIPEPPPPSTSHENSQANLPEATNSAHLPACS